MERRRTANLDDIRRTLRLGMGPCQGGFCIYRATGILHAVERLDSGRERRLALLLAGALERRAPDPLRRPTTTGPTGRLDLPGSAGGPALAHMTYDTVVIGAGLAGLTAALRLAGEGQRVLVVARGVGSTHLAPATIDVLGFADEAVDSPVQALPRFAEAHPGHPYARLPDRPDRGQHRVVQELACLPSATEAGSRRTSCSPRPSGWPSRSAVVPETMAAVISARAAGSCSSASRAQGLLSRVPGREPRHASAVSGVSARAIELTPPREGEADVGSLGFAKRFEQPAFRDVVVRATCGRVEPDERVGFPAVLGLGNAGDVWRELEDAAGAAGLRGRDPASVRAGHPPVRGDDGRPASGRRPHPPRIARGRRRDRERPGRRRSHPGGRAPDDLSGALVRARLRRARCRRDPASTPTARSREPCSTSLSPAAGGQRRPPFLPTYLEEQPLDRVGVPVDDRLRPTDGERTPPCTRTSTRRVPRSRAPCRGGRPRATGSASRRATPPPARSWRGRSDLSSSAIRSTTVSSARSARPSARSRR